MKIIKGSGLPKKAQKYKNKKRRIKNGKAKY